MARIPIDPAEGVTSAKATEIAEAAGLPPQTVDVLVRLWAVLTREDAVLVQVNPLVRTAQGQILALDGKVTLDDNARFRQARWGEQDAAHDDPLEAAAAAKGLNYVKLDGEVGIIGNGAGLVMSTLDARRSTWSRAAVRDPPTSSTSARRSARFSCRRTVPILGRVTCRPSGSIRIVAIAYTPCPSRRSAAEAPAAAPAWARSTYP